MVQPIRPLTARQREVVAALARGLSYREIAEELGLSARTVQEHVYSVAGLLPNPGGLPARTLVLLWSVRAAA